jgi:hypothetical protein
MLIGEALIPETNMPEVWPGVFKPSTTKAW